MDEDTECADNLGEAEKLVSRTTGAPAANSA
jgi:hypothetical protein